MDKNLTVTQLKLRTTPTAGVSSEQSNYYRHLLSAGYKGFLQGTVGGSTLYGTIGAVIGVLVALPLLPVAGTAALALVPAMAGLGLYKGAGTFGNIGSMAAITAESAEMNEKRRYLLDRYYELPDTPEFDAEAQQIKELLARQHESKTPKQMFHWRTVAFGALLGAAVSVFFLAGPGAAFIGGHFIFDGIAGLIGTKAAAILGTPLIAAAGAALGGLSGAMIGMDRYYVRNWLDRSSQLMHDSGSIEEQLRAREQEVQKLGGTPDTQRSTAMDRQSLLPQSHDRDGMKIHVGEPVARENGHGAGTREAPIRPHVIAGLDNAHNRTQAREIAHQGRVEAAQLVNTPAV